MWLNSFDLYLFLHSKKVCVDFTTMFFFLSFTLWLVELLRTLLMMLLNINNWSEMVHWAKIF